MEVDKQVINLTFLDIMTSRHIVLEISPSKALILSVIKPSFIKIILLPPFLFLSLRYGGYG